MYKANSPYTQRETSAKWKLNSHGKNYSLCTYTSIQGMVLHYQNL